MIRKLGMIAVALMASTQAVQAQAVQQHDQKQDASRMMEHGMMGQGMQMGMGGMDMMMMAGLPSAATILGASDALKLSAEQTTRLEALQKKSTEASHPHMQQAMAAHMKAVAALKGDAPNVAAFESALNDAMNHMVKAHASAAQYGLDARAVLTADQRTKLIGAMDMMRGMMGHGSAMPAHGMSPSGMGGR